jgi:DNA-binding MarR family transcriptional regulator
MSVPSQTPQKKRLPHLERSLTYRLHVINKISDRDTAAAYTKEFGLAIGEARCLAAIGRFAPLSVNDVARAANLNKGQASRCTQALVEYGLVLKQTSAVHGREVVLTVTPKGHEVYEGVIELIFQRNQEVFGCLTQDEQQLFGSMMDRIIAAIDATSSPESASD